MVHDRIPICTGGQQRCCIGVCVWRVGYLGGRGVRDKTESEISFVPAGSAPTFLLPCCQFYQSHARTQTQIRISRDPLFPYIRVLLRRIYRIETPRLALFLQMVTFRPRFIAVTTGRTRARFFSLMPLVIGRGRDISLFDRVFSCRFSPLCARRSFFLFCLLSRSLFCVQICMFDLAEIVSCRLVMSSRAFVFLLLAESIVEKKDRNRIG